MQELSVPMGLIVQTNGFIEKDNNEEDTDSDMSTIADDRMETMYFNMVANERNKKRNKTKNNMIMKQTKMKTRKNKLT